MKYAFHCDDEYIKSDTYDSVEDCIKGALQAYADGDDYALDIDEDTDELVPLVYITAVEGFEYERALNTIFQTIVDEINDGSGYSFQQCYDFLSDIVYDWGIKEIELEVNDAADKKLIETLNTALTTPNIAELNTLRGVLDEWIRASVPNSWFVGVNTLKQRYDLKNNKWADE